MSPRPRAVVVVTGSELVRGERTDRNGPFYAREALSLGLVPERIVIVGDDPERSRGGAARRGGADVCLVSGGLGPTHDDRTVELVARVAGAPLRVDAGARGADRGRLARGRGAARPAVRRLRARRHEAGDVPEGAVVVGIAGTAPGSSLGPSAVSTS